MTDRPDFRAAHPEDFVVEEIPAFPPAGTGDHAFVLIEKRLVSTQEAIARLCAALGADPAAAGWAGMKDRVAVARQWISLYGVDAERVRGVEVGGVRVLDVARHPRRLRTGQLRGNRFVVRVPARAGLAEAFAAVAREGLANRFGPQRFAGDNLARGRALVLGSSPVPRDRVERRLLVSAVQAAVFNAYLDARPPGALEGEPLRRGRPTGPVPGTRMPRAAAGTPARALEDAALARIGVAIEDFRRVRRLGRGTRRMLRLEIEDPSCERDGDALVLRFTLGAGSYATEVLSEVLARPAAPTAGHA